MAMTITNGSSIKFKHGTDAALEALRADSSKIEVGAFYLTHDTHRMYIGVSEDGTSKIVPVNEGITTYAKGQTPPGAKPENAGQFIYLSEGNILAVSNGQHWIQLNYNTDTLYDYSGIIEATKDADDNAETNSVIISTSLVSKDNPDTDDEFAKENAETDSFSFKVVGKNGIIVAANGDTLEIYGHKLGTTVSNGVATIQMVDKDGKAVAGSGVTVESGDNIEITSTTTGFKISTADTILDGSLDHGSAEAQGFKIFAEDTSGQTSGGTIDPIIKYGASGDQTVHFENGTATLNVYTKAEVDSLRTAFDAMEYQGVITATPSAKDGIKKGYTWKAKNDFVIYDTDGETKLHDVKTGDLIIANIKTGKAENAETGLLAAEDILWEVVPSGNEDTTYSVATTGAGIQIKEQALSDADATAIGGIEVYGDGVITATAAPTNNFQKITITHNVSGRVDPEYDDENDINLPTNNDQIANSGEIEVVDSTQGQNGIETDDYGHVTKVYTKKYTIYDTNAKLTAVGAAVSEVANSNSVNLTVSASLKGANDATSTKTSATAVNVKSNSKNLKVSTTGTSNISFDLVWDTFGVN